MRLIAALVLALSSGGAVWAQTAPQAKETAPQAKETAPQALETAARPDLADLMAGAQWRHLKLSYAGDSKNWPLTIYEAGQLRKNFAQAVKFYPEVGKTPFEKLVAQSVTPALDRVEAAAKAKDRHAFRAAFDQLSEACNSCHHAAGFGEIRIHEPESQPFSNQLFAPGH